MFDPFPGERSRARQQDISRMASRRATEHESGAAEHSPTRGRAGHARGRLAVAMAGRLRRVADRLDYRWTLDGGRATNPSRSGTDLQRRRA